MTEEDELAGESDKDKRTAEVEARALRGHCFGEERRGE